MSTKKERVIYSFNIIAEAKARALVLMTKKVHPDWSKKEIEDHLKRLIGYAVEKEVKVE